MLAYAAGADAQPSTFTGMITAHVGAARGGDVRDLRITPGVSMAVVDDAGLGAELDVAHARNFADGMFAESGVTSVMLNLIVSYPHASFQPFVNAGVGVLHTRVAIFEGQPTTGKTDVAFSAGGGMQYMFDELVGVRGDVRYFRDFQRREELPLLDSGYFDFWRTSIGITLAWPVR